MPLVDTEYNMFSVWFVNLPKELENEFCNMTKYHLVIFCKLIIFFNKHDEVYTITAFF